MNSTLAKPTNAEEQYQLILECRSSGLSDYQWCPEHGINPGTFYNWVKRICKKACYDIPDPVRRNNHVAMFPFAYQMILIEKYCFRFSNIWEGCHVR